MNEHDRHGRNRRHGGRDRLIAAAIAQLGAGCDPRRHGAGPESFGDRFAGGPGGMGRRGGGGRGGRGPGGGRRRRLFDQAELQTLLLALIGDAPRHGYDLIREIETLSGGEYAPSPGVVYPALTYMEESGLIAPSGDEASRKAYGLTEEGRARVTEEATKAAELRERLTALAAHRDKVDPAPIRRAMHALKTAIFDSLSIADADRDLVLKVADAIDEATRKIERIER